MNRLAGQTSPYLLQHADNPVAWHPWDAEALALAKRENKPILLSIGYSACHWCHVMAHESFENETVARQMNAHFINIKVDREERPDLDRIYQTAHQLLTRNRGGWPLTMFLDPNDQLPFFGGTYFPPEPRHGMPGFADVLRGISDAYSTHNDQIEDYKTQMRDALAKNLGTSHGGDIDTELVDRACGQLNESFDESYGGFGDAPKFPHPAGLELLLDAAECTADAETCKRLLYIVDFTLSAMSCGGLYDHLGGGFYRYSVDAQWSIPHFEKMLYDNGPLLSLYVRRARHTGAAWFRAVANSTADWMLREMALDNGGLCSSLDADSEGEEGRYYVWDRAQVSSVLGPDHVAFAARYGLSAPANFEDRWHLRLAPPDARPGTPAHDPAADLSLERARLLEARSRRVRPARDDKVLTSWNALCVRALADIGRQFDRHDCLLAAGHVVDYLFARHWRDGRLLATSRHDHAHLNAYLDDYAFLLDALLSLLSARWRTSDLVFARALADVLLDAFEDRKQGGFFFTSNDHESLIQRSKSFADDSLPAGNGIAVRALLELGHLIGEMRYVDAAGRALGAAMGDAARWPQAHATVMSAILDHAVPPPRIILRHDPSADLRAWFQAVDDELSMRARCYPIPNTVDGLPGLLSERVQRDGAEVTAYVCTAQLCHAPMTTLEAFRTALATGLERAESAPPHQSSAAPNSSA